MVSPALRSDCGQRLFVLAFTLLTVPGICGAAQRALADDPLAPGGPAGGLTIAPAAGGGSDVERLRDEVDDLRRQVLDLALELRALRGVVPAMVLHTSVQAPVPAPQAPAAAPLPPEMLQAQIEELAQVKVEAASRFPVTLSGTIVSNTVVNSGDANWLESPNIVGTAAGGSMTSTMRQSRVGLDVHGIPVGSWEAKGALILDFFGGTPGFVTGTVMGLPRLLYAYGRLEHRGTAIEIGQDHVLLAPRDPTSLAAFSFPQFFRSGNLYLRAPQVRVEQRVGGVTVKAGLVAPVAGDAPRQLRVRPRRRRGRAFRAAGIRGTHRRRSRQRGCGWGGASRRVGSLRLDQAGGHARQRLGRGD